jgi:hypothetical protein
MASAVRLIGIALVALALAATGCGRGSDRAAVGEVTDTFFAALGDGDGDRACEQLSPETRAALEQEEQADCRDAVTKLDLSAGSVGRVEVEIASAMVELSSGESAFLDQTKQGWRLSAAGCRPRGGERADGPYDCELED